jgi:hypothetical protein
MDLACVESWNFQKLAGITDADTFFRDINVKSSFPQSMNFDCALGRCGSRF